MSQLQKPSAVLFDWDNTLINTWPKLHKVMNLTLSKYGKDEWSREELMQNTHKSIRDYFPHLFGESADEAHDYFYYLYKEKFANDELLTLDGAERVLKFLLDKNIPTGIVSNKNGDVLRKEIAHLKWNHLFKGVIGSKDSNHDKPHPSIVANVLDKMGIQINHKIWFIGDTTVDIKCASDSGCTPILFGNKIAAPGADTYKYIHIPTHSELIQQLKTLL